MHNNDRSLDKAGKSHWDKTERNMDVEFQAFAPTAGIRGYAKRMWSKELFEKSLRAIAGSDKKLLELGCGGSAFLPYFANEFGFKVFGIDYSERGCELARRMCDANGVSAEIVCADFFDAPPEWIGQFDIVVTFGVVEHFTDTASTLSRFAKFLKPGGLMLTMVPNMHGLVGFGQKLLSRSVFDVHEAIDPERLRSAHDDAALTVIENRYFLFVNFGVINPGTNLPLFKRFIFSSLRVMTGMVWAIESTFCSLPPNRFTSPYVICVCRVPENILERE